MVDQRFFIKKKETIAVSELAEITQSKILGDNSLNVSGIATLSLAKAGDLSFFTNNKYKSDFIATQASVCICDAEAATFAPQGLTLMINANPYYAYALVTQALYHNKEVVGYIAKQAVIHATAQVGENSTISEFAVIGENVKIGKNCFIGAHTHINDGVQIGDNTKIMHNVTLTHTIIGNNTTIFSGCRIGQDGFGYAPSQQGIIKVEQLGRVIIGNHIEIGANTTIDRGAIEDTAIGDGTKIDNLVQIGHNVHIGRNCFIVAQAGIAGSTIVGDGVMIGGQAGLAGHITIGKGVKIAAQSGIMSNLEPGAVVGGTPSLPLKQWLRATAMLKKMTNKDN
jgi:UDP-3-O-[3-hydroxymyristoyl] glucosamine N-acyltransferase